MRIYQVFRVLVFQSLLKKNKYNSIFNRLEKKGFRNIQFVRQETGKYILLLFTLNLLPTEIYELSVTICILNRSEEKQWNKPAITTFCLLYTSPSPRDG